MGVEDQATASDDLVGRKVDKYQLVRLLGVGGMGRVYEGVHATLGKSFALKFIDPESATPEAVQRFKREAQAASSVESAHIGETFDVGTTADGLHFIAMELLRGEDLGHRIRRLGRLELPEALRIAAHVLRGLARAHDAGIVHRDLKPDNVFLVERDDDPCFAKILDFGVSKIQRRGDGALQTITREGVVLGTPVYMSPEQAQALPDVDARSDLYSVGAILYETLSGRAPCSGATYEQVIVNICTKDVDDVRLHNPLVPASVAAVLKKALCRERADRYASAREMLDAIVEASEGTLSPSLASDSLRRAVVRPPASGAGALTLGATVAAPPPTPNASSPSERPTSRALVIAAALAIGLGGVAAGVLFGRGGTRPGGAATPRAPVTIVVENGPREASPGASSGATGATATPSGSAAGPTASAASAASAATASATAAATSQRPHGSGHAAPSGTTTGAPPKPTSTGLPLLDP